MKVDGVEITEENAGALVDEQLARRSFQGRDDPTALDWITRAYDAARGGNPAIASAISRALAAHVGTSDVNSSLVARFFGSNSDADGGDALVAEVVTRRDRYPWSTPDPIPGGVATSLRGALLRAAATWRTPTPALLDVLRAELATPDGAWSLLAVVWPRDRAWVVANLDRILKAEPRGAFPAYLRLKLEGMPPAEAIRTVLAKVDRVDVESFEWAIRREVTDSNEAEALRKLMASKPALPSQD